MSGIFGLKAALSACAAVAGGVLGMLFGQCTIVMQTLLIFMVVDYLSGLLVAVVFKRSGKTDSGTLSSRAGFIGVCRKGGILLVLLVANQLDRVLDANYTQPATALFFIWNEGLSILENLGLMGVPFPPVLKNALDALRGDEKDDGE